MRICRRLPFVSPEAAFAALAELPQLVFLDSSSRQDLRAKVSYIGFCPQATLTFEADTEPYTILRNWLKGFGVSSSHSDWPFDFLGGAIGWIGYDLARAAAGVSSRFLPMAGLPAGWFGLYTCLLGFDLVRNELFYLGTEETLTEVMVRLDQQVAPCEAMPCLHWQAELDEQSYKQRHEALRAYIAAGDVYQANLTMRFKALRQPGITLAALYQQLRQLSPAPFSAYIESGGGGLACASPERFLRLSADGDVETRPIKGTAARHTNLQEDVAAAAALSVNPKERAENLMITDLLRNDLGKVCQIGSVRVPQLWHVESYAQAHHLVSVVTGRLREGLDAFDLLAATLPGGSITGAPKRRAMQIIDELEDGPRGAYCGVLAWIGFDGAMDSAIIIRTLTASDDTFYAQAGGGITWDSICADEYQEAMLKISPLLALGS